MATSPMLLLGLLGKGAARCGIGLTLPAAGIPPPPRSLPLSMRHAAQQAECGGLLARWQQQRAGYSQSTETLRRMVNQGPGGAPGGAAFGPGGIPVDPSGVGAHARPSQFRIRLARFLQVVLPITGISLLTYAFTHPDAEPLIPNRLPPQLQYLAAQQTPNEEVVTNWSGTHDAKPKRYFFPQTEQEVEAFVRLANEAGQKLRVVGSALSPNGLGMSNEGMLSMGLLDKVLKVDAEKMQVTVQAGCRVQQLADALKPHGLTLQNYASIREQQIGGFTQVGAHGTGASIPPVDETVVSLKMATPALGLVTLSQKDEPELFSLAKVGLGALGVVTQLTLQCVPRHQLEERTITTTAAEVKKNHKKWLKEFRHLRYMWIPYTDTVVVVQINPIGSATPASLGASSGSRSAAGGAQGASSVASSEGSGRGAGGREGVFTPEQRLQPLRELYTAHVPTADPASVSDLSATGLRDHLLALNPLDPNWVAQVNKAEAEYWRRSAGVRVGYSDEILGFDCGGQQWVLETAFKVADSLDEVPASGSRDIQYMETLMAEIKKAKIAAPSPIEQRWTSGSSSAMSPAAGGPNSVHSWVGVIMYLPDEPEAREKVTDAFRRYTQLVQDKLMPKYDAVWHWAKLEPSTIGEAALQRRLSSHYPVKAFSTYRMLLDPNNVLGNEWLDRVLPIKA